MEKSSMRRLPLIWKRTFKGTLCFISERNVYRKLGRKPLTREQVEKLLRVYEEAGQGKRLPYCGIILWYLHKRLSIWDAK